MKFKSNIEIQAGLEDAGGSPGAVNQLLSSTVTGTAWIDPSTIVAEAATLVVIACKNTSGAAITKGTPVYQTGTVGATATIEIASADALISSGKLPAIGLLQTTLNNNGFGFVVISGALTNFTTSPIDGVVPVTGDKVFVKSGGGLTLTKPTGEGNGIQNMGLVGKVAIGSAGSITVSSIMRTNDVPNLPEGRIWVGDGNTIVSDTVYVDEPNNRVGIGTDAPSSELEITKPSGLSTLTLSSGANITYGGGGILNVRGGTSDYTSFALNVQTANGTQEASMGYSAGAGRTWAFDANQRGISSSGHTSYNFKNSGSSQMVIYNNNVGIGTTSPSAKLEVNGAISAITSDYVQGTTGSRLLMHSAGTGNSPSYIQAQRSGGTSNAEDLNLQLYGGNASIGGAAQINRKLKVYGNTLVDGTMYVSGASNSYSVEVGQSRSTEGVAYLDLTGEVAPDDYGLRMIRYGGLNAESKIAHTGTANLTINAENGGDTVFTNTNVGIGTTAPAAKLHIKEPTASTSQIRMSAASNEANYGYLTMLDNTVNTAKLTFGTTYGYNTPVDAMTIFNGNVGIGTTSPAAKLHVLGSSSNDSTTKAEMLSNSAFSVRPHSSNSGTLAIAQVDGGNSVGMQFTNGAGTSNWDISMQPFGGNVGIGTTSPGYKLDVNGALHSSNITVADGMYHESDTNTYINFLPDTIQMATAGSVRAYITSTGNVGIGTTSPGAKLHVAGVGFPQVRINDETNQGESGIRFRSFDGVSNGVHGDIFVDGAGGNEVGRMGFRIPWNETEKMTILSSGNVGIGTTSPDTSLTIKTGSSAGLAKISSDGNGAAYSANGDVQLYTNNSAYAINFFSANKGSNLMRITDSGNVGIGTTNPYGKLDVAGDIRLQSGNRIFFGGTGSIPYWTAGLDNTTNNNFVIGGVSYYSGDRDILLTPANNGNVGIGTTSPSQLLHVAGNMRLQNQLYDSTNSLGSNGEVLTKVSAGTEWKVPAVNAQMPNNTAAASAANVGTIRYRSTSNTSFVDMSMQTGATTYTWVNIVSNFW